MCGVFFITNGEFCWNSKRNLFHPFKTTQRGRESYSPSAQKKKRIYFFLETFFSQRKTPKQLCLRMLNLAWIRNVSFALFEEICFWDNNVINIFKLPAEHALSLTLFIVLNTHQSAVFWMATGKAVDLCDPSLRHLQWVYSVFQKGKGQELSSDLDTLLTLIEKKWIAQ